MIRVTEKATTKHVSVNNTICCGWIGTSTVTIKDGLITYKDFIT